MKRNFAIYIVHVLLGEWNLIDYDGPENFAKNAYRIFVGETW
jgi:hypothetical protein